MSKEWGFLCPEGDGLLLEREDWTTQGVVWCPSEDTHGGNGRFYRRQEVVEGWWDPSKPKALTPEQLAKQAELAARSEARQEEWRMATQKKATAKAEAKEKAPRTPSAAKTPKECTCGCGGMTKGGRFLPGHDARFHAAEKKKALEAAGAEVASAADSTFGAEEAAPTA